MELFACDLHINQILVDNSTGGGQGRGMGREGVKGCRRLCRCRCVRPVYVGELPTPLCSLLLSCQFSALKPKMQNEFARLFGGAGIACPVCSLLSLSGRVLNVPVKVSAI